MAVLADGQRALSRRRVRPFLRYAPFKIEYAIDRFAMEVKRQLDVLDRRLADNRYMCGDDYTIADIAIWPWYGALVANRVYEAAEFLDAASYTHVNRWTAEIAARAPVSAGAWSTAPRARPKNSFTSATTPATSRPGPRTSWSRQVTGSDDPA